MKYKLQECDIKYGGTATKWNLQLNVSDQQGQSSYQMKN
jgi:hypothetical protein